MHALRKAIHLSILHQNVSSQIQIPSCYRIVYCTCSNGLLQRSAGCRSKSIYMNRPLMTLCMIRSRRNVELGVWVLENNVCLITKAPQRVLTCSKRLIEGRNQKYDGRQDTSSNSNIWSSSALVRTLHHRTGQLSNCILGFEHDL
jgi:hypothetical protein